MLPGLSQDICTVRWWMPPSLFNMSLGLTGAPCAQLRFQSSAWGLGGTSATTWWGRRAARSRASCEWHNDCKCVCGGVHRCFNLAFVAATSFHSLHFSAVSTVAASSRSCEMLLIMVSVSKYSVYSPSVVFPKMC